MKGEFIPKSHLYLLDGRPVPSTTQVLSEVGLLPDWSKVNRTVLEHRRQLGTAVSACLHFLQEGDLNMATVDEEVKPMLAAHQLFVKDTGFVPDPGGVEMRMWPTVRGMSWGGTLDCKGRIFKNEPAIIDWKISEGQPEYAWAIQTLSYAMGCDCPLVSPFRYRRFSCQLLGNGRYRLKEWDCAGDKDEWLWALGLVWKRINRGEKPWEEKLAA